MPAAHKDTGPGWLLGIAAVGYFLYKKVLKPGVITPIKTVNYVTRLRVNMPGVRLKGNTVELDLFIQNPNTQPLAIDAIVGDVWITYSGKDMKVGNVANYPKMVLKPLAETKVLLTIKTKFLPLVAYFSDLYAGKVKGQMVTFKGTVTVNNKPWPVKESVSI